MTVTPNPQITMRLNPGSHYLFDTTFFSDLLDQQDMGITIEELERFGEGRSGYSIITLAELCAKPVNDAQLKLREQLLQFLICYHPTENDARQAGEFHRHFLEQHQRNPHSRVTALQFCAPYFS